MSVMTKGNFIPKKVTTKQIAIMALLIAIEVVLSRFLAIPTPIVKVSMNFLPVVLMAILYGPVFAGIGAAMADFIGAMMFPVGAYFPGFTLTAFFIGAVYGLFLYKGEIDGSKGLIKVFLAAFIVTVILQLGVETLWVAIITTGNPDSEYSTIKDAYMAWLSIRAVRTAFMLPIQVLFIRMLPLVTKHIHSLASQA